MVNQAIPVAVVGATGMVGQRFIQLLTEHPWFTVVALAASAASAGKSYAEAVKGRWISAAPVPGKIASLPVFEAGADAEKIATLARVVFSAVDLPKDATRALEERYAELGCAVVSNNSAHRWSEDVPMLIPEINAEHCRLIDIQRARRGWKTGCIAVKPNCSIQSYVPILNCWRALGISAVRVTTMQAISGAGKTFSSWPDMVDNVIPYIGGEEEKSEREPLKIWGRMQGDNLQIESEPPISATCIRVPVSDGHMASVAVRFKNPPSLEELKSRVENFENQIAPLNLPSAPKQFIHVFDNPNDPQTRVHRDLENGMAISLGRLERDNVFDITFVGLSHNTLRGAAGGAVLMAELLVAKGYIK